MDARRYDRNADQLSQIFWHLTRLPAQPRLEAEILITRYKQLIEEALRINDELGQMAEKGLI
jgi:hypothetical protein